MALRNQKSIACIFASLFVVQACGQADTSVGGRQLDEASESDGSGTGDTDGIWTNSDSATPESGDGGVKESVNGTQAETPAETGEETGTAGDTGSDTTGDESSSSDDSTGTDTDGTSTDTGDTSGTSDTGDSTETSGNTDSTSTDTGDTTTGDSSSDEGTEDSTDDTSTDTGNDTEPDDGLCRDVCGTENCGTCPPDNSIDIGGFSINATEVTYRDYQLFVDANVALENQPAECEWNDSMQPPAAWPPDSSRLDFAVVYINWCQARAYCEWSGQRLCGKIDGGSNAYISYNNPNKSQWYHACTDGGNQPYPYGDDYDPNACNGEDFGFTRALPVPTMDTCEGPYGGLFDMNGNVYEWTDECEWNSSRLDKCRRRGGAFYSEMELLRCGNGSSRARDHVDDYTGFRCCSI